MTGYLYQQGIRIFDYTKFTEPLRESIRENAETLAKASGLEIEFIRKKNFRAKTRVQEILKVRGEQAALDHIFSATGYAPRSVPGMIKRRIKPF